MFFKKKVKAEKKEFIIGRRIETLFKKVDKMFGTLGIYGSYDGIFNNQYRINFTSALGERTIIIGDDFIDYLKDDKTLFYILIKSDSVEISPIRPKLTAEEMDLAILEFENFINDLYENGDREIKRHEDIVNYFLKTV